MKKSLGWMVGGVALVAASLTGFGFPGLFVATGIALYRQL